MSAKLKLMLPLLIVAVILAGYSFIQNPPPQTVHRIKLKITQLKDGTWKVKVDSIDGHKNTTNSDTVRVNRKTMITWEVKGTDAYFQFPDDLFNKTTSGADTLSDNYTTFIRDGHKLKLKIKADAPKKTYVYSIFCTNGNKYASGDSPPKIIVN
jgi:outer membrane receptor protein involved in Fe transport